MSSPPNHRKRPAPGASPSSSLAHMPQPYPATQADQTVWNNGVAENGKLVDNSLRNLSSMGAVQTQSQFSKDPALPAEFTALARRDVNQALVPVHPYDPSTDLWGSFGEGGALVQQQPNGRIIENESIERLEELAQHAKKEAQGKRKQIPPFVQKLSSFLDESRNTELIRWSDKGDSFIVLDEDEFAKTLIPELFKHNNYASFVRQLNMYGFHKRVGLSDNSMKASERKNKTPSEYYNPYFRRGHPNLLWLINKPRSGNSKKKIKKEDGAEADSEDDGATEEKSNNTNYVNNHAGSGARTAAPETGSMSKLLHVQGQIERFQHQQAAMSDMVNKLRRDYLTLSQQAVQFQNQHTHHERSIKAILTFLANIFRKSLEESGGAQSVQDILANLMPAAQLNGQNIQMPQGSVVDLGDYVNQNGANSALSPMKRAQRLLPPIPPEVGKASTVSPSPGVSPEPQVAAYHAPEMGTVTEIFDNPADVTSPSSAYVQNELQSNPHETVMKIIEDTNAGKTALGLPRVNNLSSEGSGVNPQSKTTNSIPGMQEGPSSMTTSATAVPTVQRTQPLSPTSLTANLAVSPGLSHLPPPSMSDVQEGQAQLDFLQQLNQDQAQTMADISNMLGSFSPSGPIHGVQAEEAAGGYYDLEFDNFFNTAAFEELNPLGAGNLGPCLDGNDFNFSMPVSMPGPGDLQGTIGLQDVVDGDPSFSVGAPHVAESTSATAIGSDSPATASPKDVPPHDPESLIPDPKRRRVE